MKRFVDQDLSAAEFRECTLDGARLIGVVMQDAEIDGLVTNLVVNGVERLKTVTPAQLAALAPIPEGDGWPPYARGRSTRQCLGTVLNEEWAHHGFCVRDLDLAEASDG